jgi:transcription elongation GreA/GreB family factor
MGGSYYGSKAFLSTVGKHITSKEYDDNKISVVSPLGKKLLNHEVGDTICVELPDGSTEKYLIIQIED